MTREQLFKQIEETQKQGLKHMKKKINKINYLKNYE